MAVRREHLDFVMGQMDGLDGVEWRAMMGEAIRHDRGRTVGGIDVARLPAKPVRASEALLPGVPREYPHRGAGIPRAQRPSRVGNEEAFTESRGDCSSVWEPAQFREGRHIPLAADLFAAKPFRQFSKENGKTKGSRSPENR